MNGVAGGKGSPLLCLLLLLIFMFPYHANAHSFATPYTLPIPFWMYAYGCAATLILTFAILAFFAGSPGKATRQPSDIVTGQLGRWHLIALQFTAVVLLIVTVFAGFIGGTNPSQNISMTLFWVILMLGLTYLTLFVGNIYSVSNPWKLVIAGLEKLGADLSTNRMPGLAPWGGWLAFLGYVGLIWLELFVSPSPLTVSLGLIAYTLIVILGATLVGKESWFNHFDVFEMLFGLIGKMAPLEYRWTKDQSAWHIVVRAPMIGALKDHPKHLGAVVFILFMLASTAYDGIHGTVWWMSVFWTNLLWGFQWIWGDDLLKAQNFLMGWYNIYQRAGLVVLPFIYLAIYVATLICTKFLTRTSVPLKTLIFRFVYSILPVALAYNFTHYFTMLISQIMELPCILSDPLDMGWNLFTVAACDSQSVLSMGFIWHLQVAVLLAGHIGGVYLTHKEATRIFVTRQQVLRGQVPLTILMIFYTVFGLWILSLPLGVSNV